MFIAILTMLGRGEGVKALFGFFFGIKTLKISTIQPCQHKLLLSVKSKGQKILTIRPTFSSHSWNWNCIALARAITWSAACSVGSNKLLDKHCPSQVDQNLDPPMYSLEGCHYVYTSLADCNRHKLFLHNRKRRAML